MTRYWVIAPVELKKPEVFDNIWQYDVANNVISIGWSKLGDVSKMSREKLSDAIKTSYPDKPPQTKGLYSNMIWAFYHNIHPDDFVIARRGQKILAAIGKVRKSAEYSPEKNPANSHSNYIEVEWQEQPRDKVFPNIVFPRQALTEISEVQFNKFLENTIVSANTKEEYDVIEPEKEKYLENIIIISNFDTIFQGKMNIYEDSKGNNGQQYATDIGLIDILAFEPASNSFIIIELKKGRSSDKVVGQILRYMGWIKKNLCKAGQSVKGLVICSDPDPKLSYAIEMTSNIDIRYYSMSFKLRETP